MTALTRHTRATAAGCSNFVQNRNLKTEYADELENFLITACLFLNSILRLRHVTLFYAQGGGGRAKNFVLIEKKGENGIKRIPAHSTMPTKPPAIRARRRLHPPLGAGWNPVIPFGYGT